ncbi:uncharacterized protein LOC110423464 [Herrania umbratica]|uniref:RING-type E3 ubiquitin transferase n=1 Tax=Herrania umbratica TaxID=108875 RepID=A0A6J1B1Y7_9ROSI|nr:uncharacterized protein LOC110423464 [Herrania umbratica]
MASFCHCEGFYVQVFQPPNIVPEPHVPTPLFVQLEVTIILELSRILHYCSIDYFTDSSDTEPFLAQEILRFDLHVVKDRQRVTEILGSMLTRLGINPYSLVFNVAIGKLIKHGLRLSNCTSSMGRIVLPLHAKLWGTLVEHVNHDQGDPITTAFAESALEFETSNCGMLPAKESSIKKMLKRVRVEGGESAVKDQDCKICSEEFEVGSVASEMPCFHTFHEDCIETWLKQSNCCPICRFELPT